MAVASRSHLHRAARARLPRLPRVRARAVAQHARGVPLGPAAVRRVPAASAASRRSRSTHADVAAFLSGLAEGDGERPPVAPATLQRKVACLRSFHRHLRREDLIVDDPTAHIRAPRQSRRLPKVLTRDEVGKLLAQPQGTEPAALRDRAMLELMYACGLRASEAVDLDVSDLDLEEAVLRARGKGSKERLVPVGSAPRSAPSSPTSSAAGPQLVGLGHEPRLFVNHRGQGLTRQGLYKIVQRHALTAGPAGQDEPAHAAPLLRHPPARRRLRPARRAGDARPRRHRHHAALHAPVGRPPEGRVLRGASPRAR